MKIYVLTYNQYDEGGINICISENINVIQQRINNSISDIGLMNLEVWENGQQKDVYENNDIIKRMK